MPRITQPSPTRRLTTLTCGLALVVACRHSESAPLSWYEPEMASPDASTPATTLLANLMRWHELQTHPVEEQADAGVDERPPLADPALFQWFKTHVALEVTDVRHFIEASMKVSAEPNRTQTYRDDRDRQALADLTDRSDWRWQADIDAYVWSLGKMSSCLIRPATDFEVSKLRDLARERPLPKDLRRDYAATVEQILAKGRRFTRFETIECDNNHLAFGWYLEGKEPRFLFSPDHVEKRLKEEQDRNRGHESPLEE